MSEEKGKEISRRSREQTRGCKIQQWQTDSERRKSSVREGFWVVEGVCARSMGLEAKRNGSQLCFCMITAKTSFASGNEIQTRSADSDQKKPSLSLAAEIKGLLLKSHRFAYEDEYLSWIIFINILLHTKNKPNWPTCTLFISDVLLGEGGQESIAYSWHVKTHFQSVAVTNRDENVRYLSVRRSVILESSPHKSCVSHSRE